MIPRLITLNYAQYCAALVGAAQDSAYLCCYNFHVGDSWRYHEINKLLHSLGAAVDRGIDVRVLMNSTNPAKGSSLKNIRAASMLLGLGVPCRTYSRKITIHAKFLVVDEAKLIAGSHNLSYNSLNRNFELSVYCQIKDPNHNAAVYFRRIWENSIDFPAG